MKSLKPEGEMADWLSDLNDPPEGIMDRPVIEVNWDCYERDFPDRYTNQDGRFDRWCRGHLELDILDNEEIVALDVGGGIFGSAVLKEIGVPTFLMDPMVSQLPTWILGRIELGRLHQDWDMLLRSGLRFDIILCRGSLNYLDKRTIETLPRLLKPGGFLLANTFHRKPSSEWQKRRYETLTGAAGDEYVRCRYGNLVEHLLLPDRQEVPAIRHTFCHFSPEDLRQWMPGLIIEHQDSAMYLKLSGGSGEADLLQT